jgi:hypothetical protein
MGTGPRQGVPAPMRQPPRLGLIASSATNQGPNGGALGEDGRWIAGFAFQPEQCGGAYVIGDPCATTHSIIHTNPGIVSADPFTIQVSEDCWPSSGVDSLREIAAKARRTLDRVTPKVVEHEFWEGDFAVTTPGRNNYLTNPAAEDLTPVGGLSPIVHGLTELQAYLGDCGDGGRGMIHAPRRLVSLWQSAYLVTREPGSLILTDLYENIIVPGVGYTGGGPRAAATTLIDWSSAPASGTVTYEFPGYDDVTVAFNASVAQLETAIEASLGTGTVDSISGSNVNADHTITWAGAFEGFALEPTVTCSAACTATVTGTPGASTIDETGVTAWAYATSLTQVRLSEAQVWPDPTNLENELGARMFEENEPEFFAARLGAVTFDGCCHAGIEIDMCSTCCVPEGGS